MKQIEQTGIGNGEKLFNEQYQRLKIATPSREEFPTCLCYFLSKKHVDIIMVKLYNLRARLYYSW
jgi:hypothetical protein